MAYYDSFTKKPRDKREDLRDDTFTRRPARDSRNGQERTGHAGFCEQAGTSGI